MGGEVYCLHPPAVWLIVCDWPVGDAACAAGFSGGRSLVGVTLPVSFDLHNQTSAHGGADASVPLHPQGSSPSDATISRGVHGLVMVGAGLVATALAWFVAGAMIPSGTTGNVQLAVVGVALASAIVGLLPVLFPAADRFGLVVMAVSVVRLGFVLGGAMVLSEVLGMPARAVWIALALCAGILLLVESVVTAGELMKVHQPGRSGRDVAGSTPKRNQESCSPC